MLMAWAGWRGPAPGALLLLALIATLAGSIMVGLRRWPKRPARLSGGRFQLLPLLLLFFIAAVTNEFFFSADLNFFESF